MNIDNNSDHNIQKLDLDWDLRQPLPLPDNSVDFIFNEHFLDHLTVEEGQKSIKDFMRVLKPNGVMRIAMPDLANTVKAYYDENWKENSREYFQKFGLTFIQTRAELINIGFRWWGHKWLYDFEELYRRLREAGCVNIKRGNLRESEHQELRNLETRDESTLIAEVVKPCVRSILDCLQNDESRYIFHERIAFTQDNNNAHIDNIVKESLVHRLIENGKINALRNAKKIVCYMPYSSYISDHAVDCFYKLHRYLTEQDIKLTHICLSEIPSSTLKIAGDDKLLAAGIKFITREELVREYRDAIVTLLGLPYARAHEVWDYLLTEGFHREQFFSFIGKASPYFNEDFLGKQYFDLPEIRPDAEEVFIDGGSFDGGTLADFVTFAGGKYRKIYAFEPITSQYENVRQNISEWKIERTNVINKGLWSSDTTLSFIENSAGSRASANGHLKIPVTTIDSVIAERVTFIKLDVEGAEMEALKGAAATIRRDKPKLAISLYHLPTDVVNIPTYILSLVPEYRLFIRHYYYNHWETVLYAVMP